MRIVFLIVLAGAAGVFAQAPSSTWDGVYSAPQATRGQALYAKNCASCHADDLLGSGQAPPLADNDFRKEWDGQTVGDLYDRMSLTMPADRPNALSADEDLAILAFLLKSNGYPAGKQVLKGDLSDLRNILFLAEKEKK